MKFQEKTHRMTNALHHPKNALSAAVLGMVVLVSLSGSAIGQVAGTTRLGVSTIESSRLAMGWSARQSILGRDMFNESGEKIGRVEDLIVDRTRNVSYLIVSVGGFVGMGHHAVAVLASRVHVQGDRMVLAGATQAALAGLPPFIYAPTTRSHSSIVARAERDMDAANHRIALLEAKVDAVSDAQKSGLAGQIAALKERRRAVEDGIAEMNAAEGAAWKAAEAEVGKASARLRQAVKNLSG